MDVERLVEQDHLARAIWVLVGQLNLSAFYQAIESSAEEGGRPAFDPKLLISLWVYAYTRGIGSAREVARRCEFDPAFQWLTGLDEVNYHTLADFRVEKQEVLDELFTQVLAALSQEGLIKLDQVKQDGTKIRAAANPPLESENYWVRHSNIGVITRMVEREEIYPYPLVCQAMFCGRGVGTTHRIDSRPRKTTTSVGTL